MRINSKPEAIVIFRFVIRNLAGFIATNFPARSADMFRVRQITMDDAHIYVRPDQILSEINDIIGLVKYVYGLFKFEVSFKLSTRPDDAMGDPKLWEQAEESLRKALEQNNIDYGVKEKDGAFYGPKIDIQIKDAIGRDWQVATIQLDFVMLPERFDLTYADVRRTGEEAGGDSSCHLRII